MFQTLLPSPAMVQRLTLGIAEWPSRVGGSTIFRLAIARLVIFRLAIARLAIGLLLSGLPVAALAQTPSLELTEMRPCVGRVGSTFSASLLGAHLAEAEQLIFSHPGIQATVLPQVSRYIDPSNDAPQDPQRFVSGQFTINIDANVPAGYYDVRAVGRFGLSNPRRFFVCQSPVIPLPAERSLGGEVPRLSAAGLVLDRCVAQERQSYAIGLQAGDRLRLSGIAAELDSAAIPVVTLRSPAGHEIESARAVATFPASIDYQVPAAGEYQVQVHDFLFRGGDGFHFALESRITSVDAHPNDPAPGGTVGERVAGELERFCSPAFFLPPLMLEASGEQPLDDGMTRSVLAPGARLSPAFGQVSAETGLQDFRAIDSLQGKSSPLPLRVYGRFSPDSKPSRFDFSLTEAQSVSLQVASADWGQLTDPRVLVFKIERSENDSESLQAIAQLDDPPALGNPDVMLQRRDPQLNFSLAAGEYRVLLQDNITGIRPPGSTDFLVTLQANQPTFSLIAYRPTPNNNPVAARPIASNLMPGGTETINVLVLRHNGFNEAIELEVAGLPESIVYEKTIVPPGQSIAAIVLSCQDQAPAWTGAISVMGVAESNWDTPQSTPGSETPRCEAFVTAIPVCITQAATPQRNAVRWRTVNELMLHVNDAETAPLSVQPVVMTSAVDASQVEADLPQVPQVNRGEKMTIRLQVTRRSGGDGRCVLRPQGVPPGVSVGEVAIEADQSEASLEVQIAPDAALGPFTLSWNCETKIKWAANPQALAREELYLQELQQFLEKATSAGGANLPDPEKLTAAIASVTASIETLKQGVALQEPTVFLPVPSVRFQVTEKQP